MAPLLFVLLLVVPIAELWLIVEVAQRVGVPSTFALLVVLSVAGAWLLKQQGMATWRRLQTALRRGEMPTKEVTDGALILMGGALLLTPGFLTDIVGFSLVLPPTRAVVKNVARRFLGRWAARRFGSAHRRRVYDARATGVTTRDEARGSSSLPPSPPARSAEGGSPDRG